MLLHADFDFSTTRSVDALFFFLVSSWQNVAYSSSSLIGAGKVAQGLGDPMIFYRINRELQEMQGILMDFSPWWPYLMALMSKC